MKLTVIEYADGAPTRERSALIQPPGGTVGRSTGCDLTLDDPERRLSQVQAVLTYRDDGWYVRNASTTTPVEVNGRLLPLEQECRVVEGDHLRMGAYLIRSEDNDSMPDPQNSTAARFAQNAWAVEEHDSTSPSGSAPFADLLGGAPLSSLEPKEAPLLHLEDNGASGQQPSWVAPSYFGQLPEASALLFAPQTPHFGNKNSMPLTPPNAPLDPLALFDEPSHRSDLLENLGPSSISQTTAGEDAHLRHTEGFPDTGHPSIGDSVDIGRTALRLGQFPLSQDVEPLPTSPALFGAAEDHYIFEDPPAGIASAEPEFSGQIVGTLVEESLDGFHTLHTSNDALPIVDAFYSPSDHVQGNAAQSSPHHPEPAALLNSSEPLSQINQQPDAVDIGELAVRLALTREQKPQPEAPPASPRETESEDALVAAQAMENFLAAAGIQQISISPLSLDRRMAQMGRLLRLFADGTVRLLASRSMVKREVGAELTRVMNSANNPFKVLPSGEAVLIQMFGQQFPGFLTAEQAISESLEDLQRHQLGMLAGTRTALQELIRELDPEISKAQVTPSGLLDSLFPHRVESRRWRHYRERFQSALERVRENDFSQLFGETFLHAYEEEIRRCMPDSHQRREDVST